MSSTTTRATRGHQLSFPPLFKVEDDFFSVRTRDVSEEYLTQNSNWAEYIYGASRFDYNFNYSDLIEYPEPEPQELVTNYNLPQSENDLKGQIDQQTIQQFIQRINDPDETKANFEFTPISHISKLQKKRTIDISIPPPIDLIDCRYLKVSIGSLFIDNNGTMNQIEGAQGVLFMYDYIEKVITSEPVYFNHTFGKTILDQSNQEFAYFECRKPNERLCLVCILMNQAAYPLDDFITYLQNHKPTDEPRQIPSETPRMPIPFALSFINISDQKELQFPQYWLKFTSSEIMDFIGKPFEFFDEDDNNFSFENKPDLSSNSTQTKKKSGANSTTILNANLASNNSQNVKSSTIEKSDDTESDQSYVPESEHCSTSSNLNVNIENAHSSGSGLDSSNNQIGLNTSATNAQSLQNYICIKCESTIDLISNSEEIQEIEFCMSTDPKRDSGPMLAESVPHNFGSIPTVISLSNIKVDFNSAKKADFVFFKAYYCEVEQIDPTKPTCSGTGHFVSKKFSEEYQSVFISSPVPYSKHINFSDFIKIYIDNPIKYTTHIIIHIILYYKGKRTTCRMAVIPLFENVNYSEPVINTNTNNNTNININNTNINATNNSNNPPAINTNNSIENVNTNQFNTMSTSYSTNSNSNSLNSIDQLNSLPSLPSLPKPVPIQSMTTTLPTINCDRPSQIKCPDYLQQAKATSKTTLTVTIDIPSILYPPKVITDFADADTPEKMNISDILDLDEKIINEHFISIVARFFNLMSPLSAEYFIRFYSKHISNNFEYKKILRSWIYHKLDVKKIKSNFLTSFTSSFEKLIEQEINSNEKETETENNLLQMIINAVDILSDVFWVSCLRKTEETIPESVNNLFYQISQMIIHSVKQGNKKQQEYIKLSDSYGQLLFCFGSFSEKDYTTYNAILNHLKLLLSLDEEYQVDALIAFFEFMIQFTFSTNLAHQMIIQIPVIRLTEVMFSPYQPLLSLLVLAFYRSLQLDDLTLHATSCSFLARICMPLEDAKEASFIYRSAYAFFPFLNIISNNYENYIDAESKYELLPAILFLITYAPSQLLKNYFNTISNEFQIRFINFLKKSAETLIQVIDKETNSNQEKAKSFYGIALFKDLTQRYLQFLRFNFSNLSYCTSSVISLLDLLINTSYQTPRNFPKLFDFTYLFITSYPLNKSLIKCFLKVVISPQNIARCFGTTLLALFFQSDFINRKNVNKSSVEFIDTFFSSLLHVSPSKLKISLYKNMVIMLQRLISDNFKNEEAKQNLSQRLAQAFQIIEIFEKLINSQDSKPDICITVMKIADSNKNFPSMRMKWLKEIVLINSRYGWNNAAFVAQLHICALISAVILNRDKIEFYKNRMDNVNASFLTSTNNRNKADNLEDSILNFRSSMIKNISQTVQNDQIPFNLIITRPYLNSCNYMFSDAEFKFIPSVLVESTIDFDSLHPDFYFLLPDFTLDFLKKNLRTAVKIGLKAKMYYDVRCVLSMLFRIAIFENDGEMIAKISAFLKKAYSGVLSVQSKSTSYMSFFVKKNCIFCVDEGKTIEGGIPVNRYDIGTNETEQRHCFSFFRTRVTEDDIDKILYFKNENNESQPLLTMTQYTTTNALPRYTIKSEIIDAKTVSISLLSYAQMEEERYLKTLDQMSFQFEECYPIIDINSEVENNEFQFRQGIESDLERIYCLIISIFKGKTSLFNILKLIAENFDPSAALEMAKKLTPKVERLTQVYHTSVQILNNQDADSKFVEAVNLINSFTSAFQLQDIDISCYDGRRDPLSNANDYEIF